MSRLDRDASDGVYALRAFIILCPIYEFLGALVVVVLYVGGSLREGNSLYWALGISVLGTPILAALSARMAPGMAEHSAGMVLKVLLGMRSWRSLKEQWAGDVDTIRHNLRQGYYTEALETAERILAKDPDHIEVLTLKAKIHGDGFQDFPQAYRTLRRIMETTAREDPNYRWAREYYEELMERANDRAAKPNQEG